MTREMKVSLLVGLAFVIVMGILFSDHVAVDREKPTAKIERVVANGSRAIQVPGGSAGTGIENPITAPDQVNPQGPVVRAEDLKNGVALAGTTANTGEIDITPNPVPAPSQPIDVTISPANVGQEVVSGIAGAKVVASAAQKEPAILSLSKPGKGMTANPVTPAPLTAVASQKTYTAQSGDSVYKMVQKVYGKYTWAAEKAVLAANPDLAANPKAVKINKVYVFPDMTPGTTSTPGTAVAAPVVVAETTDTDATPAPVIPKVDAPADKAAKADKAAGKTTLYTVKDGDSLWKIAKSQLGSATPTTMDTIVKLNSDVLKGKDLRPGMKLKLPTRDAIAVVD